MYREGYRICYIPNNVNENEYGSLNQEWINVINMYRIKEKKTFL